MSLDKLIRGRRGEAFLFHDAKKLKTDSGTLSKRLRSIKTKYTKARIRKKGNIKTFVAEKVHNFKLRMA